MSSSIANGWVTDSNNVGKIIKVSFELRVDSGRPWDIDKAVSIFTAAPIVQVDYDSDELSVMGSNGNDLAPTVVANTLFVRQVNPARNPVWVPWIIGLAVTGEAWTVKGSSQQSFVIAFGGTGEKVLGTIPLENYDDDGSRSNLRFGNPNADTPGARSDYPANMHWIGSAFRNLQITAIEPGTIKSKAKGKRGSFQGG